VGQTRSVIVPVLEPWRVAVAIGLLLTLVALALWQLWTTGSIRRFQEYGFLLYATALAVVYGVVHDEVTVSITEVYTHVAIRKLIDIHSKTHPGATLARKTTRTVTREPEPREPSEGGEAALDEDDDDEPS
jgi:hypothetical protein